MKKYDYLPKRYISTIFMGLLLLLIVVQSVNALPYFVEAYDPSAVYNNYGEARGNVGNNYVMKDPVHIQDGIHVNSIYTHRDYFQTYNSGSYNMVEIGWVKRYAWSYAHTFWAYGLNGSYNGGLNGLFAGGSSEDTVYGGTYHTFKVAVDVPKTTTQPLWWWIVDGAKKKSQQLWFGKGMVYGGSEKLKKGDTNYAYWRYLQLKRSDGTYRNWNFTSLLTPYTDEDGYTLNSISGNEFKVE